MKNILITSAGRRVSLVQAFMKEIQKLRLHIKVYTADMLPEYSAACAVSDKSFRMPPILSSDYIDYLIRLVKSNNIGLVIPTIDTELELLAISSELFQDYHCNVLISEPDFIQRCCDKRKTNEIFRCQDIMTPKVFNKEKLKFPVFVKPYDGSRSLDTYIIKNKGDLRQELLSNPKNIFQEYLNPEYYYEITVDAYYDRFHKLKCVIPRRRIEVRDGEVSKGITVRPLFYKDLCMRLGEFKGVRGCINVQFFVNLKSEYEYLGTDINPRFGGGFPLSYAAGGNFPKWIILEYFMNKELRYFNKWQENKLMLRYDEAIFKNDFRL